MVKKILVGLFIVAIFIPVAVWASHVPTVGLGTATSFAVIAGAGVTNTGPTVVHGDLGSHPNSAVTGFPPGTVNGAVNPSHTAQAKDDLVTAYNNAAGRTPSEINTELGGQLLLHGVYDSASGTFEIAAGQTLTLDAQGDAGAVWIFQTDTTLVTFASSAVNLINGASHCNIFWKIGSSATIGTNTAMKGTIMALAAIAMQSGATLQGRALARNESVTLDNNVIDGRPCVTAAASPSPSPADGGTATPPPGGDGTGNGGSAVGDGTAGPTRGTAGARAVTAGRGARATGRRVGPDGRPIPFTGPRPLPIALTLGSGLGAVLIGLFYYWTTRSTHPVAVAVRGYEPRHRRRN